jgi:hypothetical protein
VPRLYITRTTTRTRRTLSPCLNENSCLRITPRSTGRCGLQLELPVWAGNSIRLFKVYRHATARSHEAEEAETAIYGPCGVMACTLGIFLSKSIYLKVAVRICAEPFFFFFLLRCTRVIMFPAVAVAPCVFTAAATPLPTRDLDQCQHERSAENAVRNSIARCFSPLLSTRNLTRERRSLVTSIATSCTFLKTPFSQKPRPNEVTDS